MVLVVLPRPHGFYQYLCWALRATPNPFMGPQPARQQFQPFCPASLGVPAIALSQPWSLSSLKSLLEPYTCLQVYLPTSLFVAQPGFSKGPPPQCVARPFPPLHPDLSPHPSHFTILLPLVLPLRSIPTLKSEWALAPSSLHKTLQAGHHLQEEPYPPLLLTNLLLTAACSPHTPRPSTLTHSHFLPRPELSHLWVFARARVSARNPPLRVSLESSTLPPPGSLLSLRSLVGPPRLCHPTVTVQIILHYSGLCTHLPPLPG